MSGNERKLKVSHLRRTPGFDAYTLAARIRRGYITIASVLLLFVLMAACANPTPAPSEPSGPTATTTMPLVGSDAHSCVNAASTHGGHLCRRPSRSPIAG